MTVEIFSETARRLLPYARRYAAENGDSILRELGSGGSASVFLLRKTSGEAALKVYDPKFLDASNGPAEGRRIELQRRLIGHSCATLIDIYAIDLSHETCFIEMEYVDWNNLKDVIAEFPNGQVEALFDQLVEAVVYLSDRKLVHRDIKPENIMVSSDFSRLKLIDLGVMRDAGNEEDAIDATDHGHRRPFVASAQYSSPEYLFRLKEPSEATWKALTIYQVGGVLHDMLTKKPLFAHAVETGNKFALAMSVLSEVPKLSDADPSLRGWAVLAANCLVKDPDLRLKLVDLDRIKPASGTGAEQLQQVSTRKRAMKQWKEAKEREDHRIVGVRTAALGRLQSKVHLRLVALIDKAYGLSAWTNGDDLIRFNVALEFGVTLIIECHIAWLQPATPFIGNLWLDACVGEKPEHLSLERLDVGQFSAAEDSDDEITADGLCNAVGSVVAAVADHIELGVDEQSDRFFDAVGLLQPLRVTASETKSDKRSF